jgi:EAL domain-containing protein (putative c-di-GMP-specific phosphodiesterase class I)/ActR/RegA family two-component response regulator
MADNVNRLLVTDSDPEVLEAIAEAARELGFSVATAFSAGEFLQLVDDFRPTAIFMDLHLEQTDGVELLRMLVPRDCKAEIVLMSGADRRVLSATLELGTNRGLAMAGVLAKPILAQELQGKLTAVLKEDRKLGAADLKAALSSGQLIAYYQPKASRVENGGWRIDSVEALVRWQHPELGLVMPDEFIPIAERSELIADLTEQVLAQALSQIREWNESGLRLKCAVNLAPSLVTDLSLPDRVASSIAQNGLDGSQLALELTETATMQDPSKTMDILTRLRVKGIGLSLDDFGTGFSSLTRLYQMPFDEMKIDKSLVMNVPKSREANTIVGSLIELAHNLGLKVCAEGVESRAALDLLEILRCDFCQGYFISRAVPGRDIPNLVMNWNNQSPASWSNISKSRLPTAVV